MGQECRDQTCREEKSLATLWHGTSWARAGTCGSKDVVPA